MTTNYLTPRIGYAVIFHPFEENAENAENIFHKGYKLLDSLNLEIIDAEVPISSEAETREVAKKFRRSNVEVIVLRLATWSSDTLLLDLISIHDVPVIVWGLRHVHSGSMCGAQQYNAVLKELNKYSCFVYQDKLESLEKILRFCLAVSVREHLQTLRLALIGARTQGMAEVICDEFSAKEVFGVRILTISFQEFSEIIQKHRHGGQNAFENLQKTVQNTFQQINVSETELNEAIYNYLALKELQEKHALHGFTIQCYPNYMGKVCLGFSLLADEGIIGACEGDINSAILMWIMQQLSRQPVHHIDPLTLFEEDNSVLGSHCGSGSVSLAESEEIAELNPVRLAENGVCVTFPSKPGIVTAANLIGRKTTYRLGLFRGKAIRTTMDFPGNPIRIQLPFSCDEFLDFVEADGFGHHWIVCYGDFADVLKGISDLLAIKCIDFVVKSNSQI